MVAAFLPVSVSLTGVLGESSQASIEGLLVGMTGAVGTFVSGHNSRPRAVSFAFLGGLLGLALSKVLLG